MKDRLKKLKSQVAPMDNYTIQEQFDGLLYDIFSGMDFTVHNDKIDIELLDTVQELEIECHINIQYFNEESTNYQWTKSQVILKVGSPQIDFSDVAEKYIEIEKI